MFFDPVKHDKMLTMHEPEPYQHIGGVKTQGRNSVLTVLWPATHSSENGCLIE